uniref:Uncharacterized protein n=1 Tax=Micrurus paraensis TaxID=1970185 RepID=A0A2D4JWI5_9SAUR
MASQVTRRRLLWLKHWQADIKHKWKLAPAPISEDRLFGAALEPLLIVTRNKKKRKENSSPHFFAILQIDPLSPFGGASFVPFPRVPSPKFQRQPFFRGSQQSDRPDFFDRNCRGGEVRGR